MNSTIGPQPRHRRAGADAGEAIFGDRRVDHALGPEFLQQALRHLVGALIFGDLLPHHEHALVLAHFFGHGIAQRVTDGRADQFGPLRHLGIVTRIGDIGHQRARGGLHPLRRLGLAALAFGLGLLVARLLDRARLRRGRGGFRRVILAGDQRDHRADLHIVGAFRHDDLGDGAFVDRLEFHGGLVGLDLGEHVAGLHLVALLDQPLGERTLPPWWGRARAS